MVVGTQRIGNSIEYCTNKFQYIPVKLSGFLVFSRWYVTVHGLFIQVFWKCFKTYQSWLGIFLGSIKNRWLFTRSELPAGLLEGSPGQLDTFHLDRRHVQLPLACVTKCTVRLGKRWNTRGPKPGLKNFYSPRKNKGFPKRFGSSLSHGMKAGSRHGDTSKNWWRDCTESSSLARYGSWISSWIWELWNITEIFFTWMF